MNKGSVVFAGGFARCSAAEAQRRTSERSQEAFVRVMAGQRGMDVNAARGKERKTRRGLSGERREAAGTDRRLRHGSEWRQR
jgi:hypothetical protein